MTTSSGNGTLIPEKKLIVVSHPTVAARTGVINDWGRTGRGSGWRHRLQAGLFVLGLGLAAVSPGLSAAEEKEAVPAAGAGIFPPAVPFAYGDDELLVPEIFQGHMPTTLQKYAVRLAVNPHIGDLRNKDHLRVTTGLRYGVTENWEVSATSDFYFSHGYGEVESFENCGVSTVRLGSKVNLGEPFLSGWKVGAGIDYIFPTGQPPAELTDGLRHLMPYLTFSHRLESHPDLRVFFGFRLDSLSHTSIPGSLGKNAFNESSSGITGGWVYDRKNWHYTFEAAYDTTRFMGDSSVDVYTVRPGVLWEIPSRRRPGTKSNWVVGLALKSTFGPGGTTLGASFRLRYSRDIKNLFRRNSSSSAP